MGFTSKGVLPEDDNGKPVLGLMDDATGKVVPVHIGSKVTGADGKTYAILDVSATVTPAANQRVNAQSGDFVDGAIATIGAKADAAITDSTTTNSQMSFIKGFVKILADAWDSGNHWLQVKVMNANANGQTTMSASAPVVIASDQSKLPTKAASGDFVDGSIATIGLQADTTATTDSGTFSLMALFKRLLAKFPTIGAQATSASLAVNIASDQTVPMKRSTVAVYSLASTTTSGSTQNSGDLTVGAYTEISIDINTTAQAGTSPTIQYFYERKAADNIYYVLWQSAVLSAATNTLSTSIGTGMAYNQSLGVTGRMRWVIGGSATPTFTHTINLQGK